MEQFSHIFSVLNLNEWLMISVSILLLINLNLFKRQQEKFSTQERTIQNLQRDLRALANAAVGVGGRVLKVERQQRNQVTSVEQHSPASNQNAPLEFYNTSNQPYEQAIRMAQTGASVDDIVNVCGLSKSEVELVCMMHRLDKAS